MSHPSRRLNSTQTRATQLVFLDTNVWNALVDRPDDPLTVDLLITAHRRGLIAIVGTLELEEELIGTSRSKPTKYAKMRRTYFRLTADRILLPQRDRHNAETLHGGALPPESRYLSKRLQSKRKRVMANQRDVREIDEEIYRVKEHQRTWSSEQRAKVRARLEEHGFNPGVDLSGWFAEADVADWMTEVRDDPRGHPTPPEVVMSVETRPTAWLLTEPTCMSPAEWWGSRDAFPGGRQVPGSSSAVTAGSVSRVWSLVIEASEK
ncbi:MAG: hypothetical protein AB7Q27_13540 [Acidimicrobiia bacterium]